MRHGSQIDPPNRFETVHRELDYEHVEWDQEYLRTVSNRKIEYLADDSKTIISENDSPDIPYRYSLNPYRGCVHGCSYCYARPLHEYLDLNAGLDFETKIIVKPDAARLFKTFLARDAWVPEPIMFSGATDCYQPAERSFRLTRDCLEVALESRQPIRIVTKNALVLRDLDLLQPMAQQNLVHLFISLTTLDDSLARAMEPRTSIPAARLRAMKELAEAGVPVGVMVAPVIPGLNDHEVAGLLEAARDAGARQAAYVLLRLPLTVRPVFEEWLRRTQPSKADRVLQRVRQTHGGKLNDSAWGQRMSGSGTMAEQIGRLFRVLQERHDLDRPLPPLDVTRFRSPPSDRGQLRLF